MKLYTLIFAVAFLTIGCSSSDDNPPMDDPGTTTGDGTTTPGSVDLDSMTFNEKIALYKEEMTTKAKSVLLEFNERYSSGTLGEDLGECIPEGFQDWPVVIAGCDQELKLTLTEQNAPVTAFSFRRDTAACKTSIADNNDADNCALESVIMFSEGLYFVYSAEGDPVTGPAGSIEISDNAQDVIGSVSQRPHGIACFLKVYSNGSYNLDYGSDQATCDTRLDQALSIVLRY